MVEIVLFVARFFIGGAFVLSGVQHFFKLDGISGYMRERGVPFPRETLIAGSIFQTLCGLLMIANLWTPWAAGGLIIFTVAASVMFHNFWDKTGPERNAQLTAIYKNMVGLGGLIAFTVI